MASGHGVSEAVRNHIPTWITEEVIEAAYNECNAKKAISYPLFKSRARDSKAWKRTARRSRPGGHEREFHNANIPNMTLYVHSPKSDYSADAYLIKYNNKLIAGGKTKLQSVFTTSKTSKDSTELSEPKFVAFTEQQLEDARVRMEYGDGFDQLEIIREI